MREKEQELQQQLKDLTKTIEGMNKLSTSLDNFPRIIEGKFNHTVQVLITGAQVFAQLNPLVEDLVKGVVNKALADYNSKLGTDSNYGGIA